MAISRRKISEEICLEDSSASEHDSMNSLPSLVDQIRSVQEIVEAYLGKSGQNGKSQNDEETLEVGH